jgi:hypothetical protein
MGLSPDPVKRQRQLANLRPRSDARLTHGAHSQVVLAPLRAEAEAWARRRWPWLDDTRVHVVAGIAAKVERIGQWEDENDVIHRRGQRAVRVHPVVESGVAWARHLEALVSKYDAEAEARRAADVDAEVEAAWQAELEEGRMVWDRVDQEMG